MINTLKFFISTLVILQIIYLNSASSEESKIKIGVILPLSGEFSRYGEKIKDIIIKVSDNKFDLIFEDEACNPLKTISAYRRLSNLNKIDIFLGPWCGSPQMSLAPLINQHKQIAFLGSSAPEDIFQASGKRIYSSQHTIESESHFNADMMNSMGITRTVILFKENSFSRAHEKAFVQHFKGKVLETIAYTNDDQSTIQSVALRLKQLSPDAVYVPDAFPFLQGLIAELDILKIDNLKLFSVYSIQMPDIAILLKNSLQKVYYSFPDIGENEAIEFFPQKATELLTETTKTCKSNIDCILEMLSKDKRFDEHGAKTTNFILKTIRDGKFVPMER